MSRTQIDSSLVPSALSASQNINNILINGGMEFWQRGTSFLAPTTLAYTADRWQVNTDESTNVTVAQEGTNIDSGLYSMSIVVSSAGALHFYRLRQSVETYASLRGKTMTITARVKTTVASAFKIAIGDNVSIQARSSYHTGSGNWETLSVTYTFGGSITEAKFFLGMIDAGDKQNGTYYVDSVMLTIGSSAVAFVPTNTQTELAQCERYYEKSYNVATTPATNTQLGSFYIPMPAVSTSSVQYGSFRFKVRKRVAPTVTAYTEAGVSGSLTVRDASGVILADGTAGLDNLSESAFRLRVTSITGSPLTTSSSSNWYQVYGHYTADAEL